MKCMHCQGRMKRGKAPFEIEKNDYLLRLERIPAWICAQCGEIYFGERGVNSIQKVIQAVDRQTEHLLQATG
jgi:YgiT-type zinc finger domain-containing protein